MAKNKQSLINAYIQILIITLFARVANGLLLQHVCNAAVTCQESQRRPAKLPQWFELAKPITLKEG
jgi:hypothetical protein